MKKLVIGLLLSTLLSTNGFAHGKKSEGIRSAKNHETISAFDIVHTRIKVDGTKLIFSQKVRADAGKIKPTPIGQLAGAEVFSYVWPTTLDSSAVGFEAGQGILALVLTAHPDFDDTPRYDENRDGNNANDGNVWHSHWVVLAPDDNCGPGALKVKDIPPGTKPRLPITWPGLPIFLDSPGYEPELEGEEVEVKVPLKDIGFNTAFRFDGVTAGLRVNDSIHNPLLCVVKVHDIASGDLSLPGRLDGIKR